MKKYIERDAAIRAVQRYGVGALDADDFSPEQAERFIISNLSTIPAADVVDGETYRELLKVAREMHRWIFLNAADELAVYDECGLTDEMNELLGY